MYRYIEVFLLSFIYVYHGMFYEPDFVFANWIPIGRTPETRAHKVSSTAHRIYALGFWNAQNTLGWPSQATYIGNLKDFKIAKQSNLEVIQQCVLTILSK